MLLSTKLRMTLKMLARSFNYGILKLFQGLGGGWAFLGIGGTNVVLVVFFKFY